MLAASPRRQRRRLPLGVCGPLRCAQSSRTSNLRPSPLLLETPAPTLAPTVAACLGRQRQVGFSVPVQASNLFRRERASENANVCLCNAHRVGSALASVGTREAGSHHVTVKIGTAPRAVHKPNAGRGTVRAREVEGTEAACARESDSSQAYSAIAVQPRERTVAKLDHAVIAPPRNCLDVGVATVVPREVVLAGRPACGAPNEPAKAGRRPR